MRHVRHVLVPALALVLLASYGPSLDAQQLDRLNGNFIVASPTAQVQAADGSASAPSYSFASDTNTGFFSGGDGAAHFTTNGTAATALNSTGVVLHASSAVAWGSSGVTSPDLLLFRDAANTLAQRNGTSLQAFRLYKTFTDASNYERLNVLAASSSLRIYTESAGTGSARALELGANGNVQWQISTTGQLLGQSNAAVGYATGSGGTVTQLTSKSTGVTLNTVTGEITMNAAALAADTTVSFVLTNTTIAAGDFVLIEHVSGGTAGSYMANAAAAAGSATVRVRNITTGSLSEAIVLKFMVFKSATS